MTSIELVRGFIGRTIALTLLLASLASITMPARASSITFSPGGCSSTVVGSGSAACEVTASCWPRRAHWWGLIRRELIRWHWSSTAPTSG